jgi:hypothetical protein
MTYTGEERRAQPVNNEVLTERVDSLAKKVDEFRDQVREDIGHLTTAIGNLTFVDQRVHDIEMASLREIITLNKKALDVRADELESQVNAEAERRAINFRLAIGALISGFLMPLLVGLLVYMATVNSPQ